NAAGNRRPRSRCAISRACPRLMRAWSLARAVRGARNCAPMPTKDEEIARLRLRRQHLTGTPLPTPEAVVGWMGAVQAQEFGVAKWSIAQRSRGRVTSADLDRALAEGRILRTHLF